MIDTHAMVKNLVAAGVPEEQAEVQVSEFARFFTYNAATKVDIAEIRRDIVNIERDIADVRKDIEALRKETKTEIELLRRDLTNLVLKAQFGGVIATVAILSALKFFL